MKKNRMMRLASVLMVAVMMTTCTISGTFAKYTSSASASDTAKVAKWSFQVSDKDIAVNDLFTFDLFGAEATDLVAPGSNGSFTINIANNSEVPAKYSLVFTENNTGIPLKYKVNGADGLTNVTNVDIGVGGTAAVVVAWEWDTTKTDGEDTALGIAAAAGNAATCLISVAASAEQVIA